MFNTCFSPHLSWPPCPAPVPCQLGQQHSDPRAEIPCTLPFWDCKRHIVLSIGHIFHSLVSLPLENSFHMAATSGCLSWLQTVEQSDSRHCWGAWHRAWDSQALGRKLPAQGERPSGSVSRRGRLRQRCKALSNSSTSSASLGSKTCEAQLQTTKPKSSQPSWSDVVAQR